MIVHGMSQTRLWILGVLLLAFCGCGHRAAILDYDVVYQPRYASGFDIRKSGGGNTLITTYTPWQGADSIPTRLLITHGEDAPHGFDGQVLKDHAQRIVAMSSTHIAMLDAIGAADKVVGVSGIDFISNPTISARRDSIVDVGYEGNINYEALLAAEPDIVLLYGVNGSSSMEGKLKEFGVPFMYVGDYVEQSPLGKAEWLVALADLTGMRDKGEQVFSAIPVRYNALKARVAEATEKPSVMINIPYGDTWFMPSTQNYTIRLLNDAGGKYVYNKNTGSSSKAIDIEEAYRLTSEADVWLAIGAANSLDDVKAVCPKFTDTRCFVDGRVYNNNARSTAAGGNDFYESGIIYPDLILRDLIKIFHPELVEEDFFYFKHLK